MTTMTQSHDAAAMLLVSEIVRRNEQQVWFLSEHLIDMPLVRAV